MAGMHDITEKSAVHTSERREKIIQTLRQQGSVQVNALAALFQVSTVTIRNDLSFLEKQGVALRAYGGALLCETAQLAPERSIADKSLLNSSVKQRIGALAASLVEDGCRLILDAGTTTLEVAKHLQQHKALVVMTNGLNIANQLIDAEGIDLLMTGGHLRRQALSFYGAQADQSLQNYHFDLLFLGVDGIDLQRGVSTHHEEEARLNRGMCSVAERIVVVTDSSKFQRRSLHKIIDIQRINTLITDDAIPPESLVELKSAGVNVLLVPAMI